MKHVARAIESHVRAAAKNFPAIVLTGPRRSGKTWMLRHLFPTASYHLFEDPDVIARFRHDPQGFLDGVKLPATLDEIQNTPEVFNYVRSRIDREPRRTGRWFLTGSQEFSLIRNVTESMAGRAAILHLLPFAAGESERVSLLHGGHPEVLARPRAASLWFSSYTQTYLERDVRSVTSVHDVALFRRFLGLVASRHGQVMNKTDLAAALGISAMSVARWYDILEATAQVLIVPPYFENMGKRLIRAPKVYVADSGLACHLLGIETTRELEKSPFLGAIFEGAVAAEIAKAQANAGRRPELYFFRDQQGLEVDFIVPGANASMTMIEAKASRTVVPGMAGPMQRLAAAWAKRSDKSGGVRRILVHRPTAAGGATKGVSPGVDAASWRDFTALLGKKSER